MNVFLIVFVVSITMEDIRSMVSVKCIPIGATLLVSINWK